MHFEDTINFLKDNSSVVMTKSNQSGIDIKMTVSRAKDSCVIGI